MDRNTIKPALLIATCLATGTAGATPIGLLDQDGGHVDARVSLISGVALWSLRSELTQGTPISGSPFETIENKDYTALVGELGNAGDNHETYVEQGGSLGMQFASGYVDAAGNLEVGVDGFNWGTSIAVSRFRLDIKNNRSYAVDMDFAFTIPEGQLRTYDPARWRGTDPLAVRSAVRANIDGLLLTPAGPFGGHFEETQLDNMFDFFVSMRGAGDPTCHADDLVSQLPNVEITCNGKVIDYTDNAFPYLQEFPSTPNVSIWGFDIDEFNGQLSLPTLAPFAELTLWYDMYAWTVGWQESGGRASLGDPLDLAFGNGFQLIEHSVIPDPGNPAPVGVPEPPGVLLATLGLLGLGFARWRKTCGERSRIPADDDVEDLGADAGHGARA